MRNLTRLIIAALASYPVLVSAQTPAPVDSFQTRYQSNLQVGDGIVIVTPTPTAPPAAKTSVAPAASTPTQALTTTAPTLGAIVAPTDTGTNTFDKNIPIEGSQANKNSTGTGTGTTTFGKNIPIEGAQVNKQPTSTGTGTFTPRKNITIENSQFQNNAAVGNNTGAASHNATAAHINSKHDVTKVVQSGDERKMKKNKNQQLQEADSDAQSMDRGDQSRKKQKQRRQLQPNQPPE
jgi:hypothetical protein